MMSIDVRECRRTPSALSIDRPSLQDALEPYLRAPAGPRAAIFAIEDAGSGESSSAVRPLAKRRSSTSIRPMTRSAPRDVRDPIRRRRRRETGGRRELRPGAPAAERLAQRRQGLRDRRENCQGDDRRFVRRRPRDRADAPRVVPRRATRARRTNAPTASLHAPRRSAALRCARRRRSLRAAVVGRSFDAQGQISHACFIVRRSQPCNLACERSLIARSSSRPERTPHGFRLTAKRCRESHSCGA